MACSRSVSCLNSSPDFLEQASARENIVLDKTSALELPTIGGDRVSDQAFQGVFGTEGATERRFKNWNSGRSTRRP
jgi:hypothetical protein